MDVQLPAKLWGVGERKGGNGGDVGEKEGGEGEKGMGGRQIKGKRFGERTRKKEGGRRRGVMLKNG